MCQTLLGELNPALQEALFLKSLRVELLNQSSRPYQSGASSNKIHPEFLNYSDYGN